MKLKSARQILRYLPRGVAAQIEREARCVGVLVVHKHGRKVTESHSLDNDQPCSVCERLQTQVVEKPS